MTPDLPTPLKCGYCGRENAADATKCYGCDTALPTTVPAQSAPLDSKDPDRGKAENQMLYGMFWCGGGILVTVLGYIAASGPGGGSYFVAWGAILYGVIQIVRGWFAKNGRPHALDLPLSNPRPPTREDVGYDALNYATALETQGRVTEALLAYQKIAETFGDSDVGRDARKSAASLKAKLG